MNKKIGIFLKFTIFTVIFYILCFIVAFLICDEHSSYTRIFMHEFYAQKNIDNLYLGASHVSHGLLPSLAEELTGESHFCTGSAGQTIEASHAILKQAVKTHKIKRVFLELDFAVASYPAAKDRRGFKADYIIAKHLRNPAVKFVFLFSLSSPEFWINSILPIGKDKHMTLHPKELLYRWKSFFNGEYFNYVYHDKDAEYGGKGCLLDIRLVKDGSFMNTYDEFPIDVSIITEEWKNTVDKIIKICKDNNIELVLYSMPCSDFYLIEKGNYDDYYKFCKDFVESRGFEYYDFNLANEKYLSLRDSDFHDDNHLSKQGVYKWTNFLCDYFFLNKLPKEDMFHTSYAKKIASQEKKIYGLVLKNLTDKKALEIKPITNCDDFTKISYIVSTKVNGEEKHLYTGQDTIIQLPTEQAGEVRVQSFLDGMLQNDCTTQFSTLF